MRPRFVDKRASLPGIDMVRLRHEQSYMYPFHWNGARPFPAGRYHAEIVGARSRATAYTGYT